MNIANICLFVFFFFFIVQLCYYLFIYLKLTRYKQQKNTFTKAVSVVVCGYNEEEYWEGLVEKLLEQDYPNFEIVLVNDQSTDNTKFVFKQWEYHPKIKLVDIKNNKFYYKHQLKMLLEKYLHHHYPIQKQDLKIIKN